MKTIDIQAIENCIFCSKNVIKKSFFSTSKFSAIYNLAPVLPGHSLIIPNHHIESLTELSETDLGEMMVFARRITSVLKKVFNCNGFDWTLQDGFSAGQTVPHLHLHVIPRKPLDLDEGEEWYFKIPDNEQQLLDSRTRKHLFDQDYNAITNTLTEACKHLHV